MIIVVSSYYPPEQAKEMVKRYAQQVKTNPEPSYLKLIGPYAKSDADKGIVVMTLYEVANERLAEGLLWAGQAMAAYIGVPGFTYTVRVWYTAAEALKTIGMTDPRA